MGENRPHSEDEEVCENSAVPDDRCKNRYEADSATETDTSLVQLMLARKPATKLTDISSNGSMFSNCVKHDLFYSLNMHHLLHFVPFSDDLQDFAKGIVFSGLVRQ